MAAILLMNAAERAGDAGAVIMLYYDRDFTLEVHDARIDNGQAERARELQAEMFVLGVAFKFPPMAA